jgi:hypothetical protein
MQNHPRLMSCGRYSQSRRNVGPPLRHPEPLPHMFPGIMHHTASRPTPPARPRPPSSPAHAHGLALALRLALGLLASFQLIPDSHADGPAPRSAEAKLGPGPRAGALSPAGTCAAARRALLIPARTPRAGSRAIATAVEQADPSGATRAPGYRDARADGGRVGFRRGARRGSALCVLDVADVLDVSLGLFGDQTKRCVIGARPSCGLLVLLAYSSASVSGQTSSTISLSL